MFKYQENLNLLLSEYISADEIEKIVGIKPENKHIKSFIELYEQMSKHPLKNEKGDYSRYIVEGSLQYFKIITFKQAAIRLGMTEESFIEVVKYLKIKFQYFDNQEIFDREKLRNIHKLLPDLQNRIFSSIQSYTQLLHKSIKEFLNLEVNPVYCTTSEYLNEPEKLLAFRYCKLSFEPTSTQYTISLKTPKPLYIEPDYCSKKVYFFNKEYLTTLGLPPSVEEFKC